MEWFESYLNLIIWLTLVLPIVSFINYEKFDEVERKFVHYMTMLAVFEIIAFLLQQNFRELGWENSLPGHHLYTLCQYIFITIFFYHLLKRYQINFPLQYFLWIGGLWIVVNSLFVQGFYMFNSYSTVGVEMIIIGFSMLYFLKVLLQRDIRKYERPISFFVGAVFFNAGMSVLIHLFSNQLYAMDNALATIIVSTRVLINLCTVFVMLWGVYLIVTRRGQDPIQGHKSIS